MAALYLTEIVNVALSTLHEFDPDRKSNTPLNKLRRNQLIQETGLITRLFSTLNIYANNPGIDTMINQLGKNIYNL